MTGPKPRPTALVFIAFTVLLDAMGFGIIFPVVPQLIMELTGEGLSQAAVYGGWLSFAFAATQLLASPILGNLSDRFGRRPVLLASLFAFGLDYLVMALAPTLGWLFSGRLLAGVAGATYATANAYVADVSAPERRAQSFGMLGASFGLGFVLGPVIGGLLGGVGPRVPFFAASALAFSNALYGFFALRESLAPAQRRPFSLRRANPVGALLHVRRYPVVFGLVGVVLLYQIAHDALPSTWSFSTMLKFGWSEREVGYSIGAVGLLIALVQGGLIRVLLPRLGERRAVYFGLSMMALGFLGFALAAQGWMMVAFLVPFALCGFAMPALRSIMSRQVPANAQGELQGALTSLMSLTAVGAPLLMTQLFGYFTGPRAPLYFPGASFFAAAVLVTGGVLLFWRAGRRQARAPAAALAGEHRPTG